MYSAGTSDPGIGLFHGLISHWKIVSIFAILGGLGWGLFPLNAGDTCAGDKFEVNGNPVCVIEGGHPSKSQYDQVIGYGFDPD